MPLPIAAGGPLPEVHPRRAVVHNARTALEVSIIAWRNVHNKLTRAEYLMLLTELIRSDLEAAVACERRKAGG